MARTRQLWGALAMVAMGCGGGEVRRFSVTLSDALEQTCTGVTRHSAFEQEVLDEIAEDMADDFEEAQAEQPPIPMGRVMHLLEREHEVRAWFETLDPNGEPVPFARPGAVYRGPPRDELVEVRFSVIRNTDEEDEEQGRELCGDRKLAEGVLTMTDADGIQGRIRWTERTQLDAVSSRCLAWIDCARNIELDGIEID